MITALLLLTLLSAVSYGQKEQPVTSPISLNHFYLTLDSETFSAIENSDFLKTEFAAFERRTTVRTDTTYTGIYFYGKHTYFEFFDVAAQAGSKLGNTGLAFGVDQSDVVNALKPVLNTKAPDLVTRAYNNSQVPWFYRLKLESLPADSVVTSWIMEYHPQFLALWNPRATGNESVRREEVLTRYKTVLNNVPTDQYLEDVIELTIAADSQSIGKLTAICHAFGYVSKKDGAGVKLTGAGFSLHLVPETQTARGIISAVFKLNKKTKTKKVVKFGSKSTLEFKDNGTAIWKF